jgi:DNA-binding NtrC family response regulator
MGHDYPGNVRELRNVLQKAAALAGKGVIHARHIQFDGLASEARAQPEPPPTGAVKLTEAASVAPAAGLSIEEIEIHHIRQLLEQHGGHRRTVADILGISERTLYRKLNRYGLHEIKQ